MASMILADGRRVARPEMVVARDGGLMGYFLATESGGYDEWLLWDLDTHDARAELTRAGIEIKEDRQDI